MRAVSAIVVLLAGMTWASAANAAEVTGTGKGAFALDGRSMPATVQLKSEGDKGRGKVSGTAEGTAMQSYAIRDGRLTEDEVSFWSDAQDKGQTYTVLSNGKVANKEIAFHFGTPEGEWRIFMMMDKATAGENAPVDVSGAWKGTFDLNGSPMPLLFNLRGKGTTVAGDVVGISKTPIEIHDGKLQGNLVSFWVNAPYGGQVYAVTCRGVVQGNKIDFTFGIADGSWEQQLTVKRY